ncbi:hypothetical protein E2562_020185 [Oryza meyeriana var. granulata]|uniref:KIB1-4 beta-propeller domain-containing protein n=1 Tax=Oryza meyeriana var. granulata TaxID=110450 RepID=A0A6G1BM24_9ORYZ|nr:hypothetical protein E2562_020185 [Oryza meyeriana var. granulata]
MHGHKILRYLVESGGRLLMVRWWVSMPLRRRNAGRLPSRFKVLEADLAAGGDNDGRWKAVDSLRGRALFLGKAGSRSVLATSQHGGGGAGAGARQDCIYFMRRTFWCQYVGDSGVYDMRSGEISPLLLP